MNGFPFLRQYIEAGTDYALVWGKYRISIRQQILGSLVQIYELDSGRLVLSGRRQHHHYYLHQECVTEYDFYDEINKFFK